jgi:predicted acyltransferase
MNKTNSTTGRIVSIDALRGFDMFWITGGDAFFIALFTLLGTPFFQKFALQLDHPAWAGFRFYDLIFPLFLFIVGLSMPFSIRKRLERGESKARLYRHIIQRTVILFFLGLVYNGLFGLDFINLRYTGVLQRIAITYFFAALIVMNFRIRGILIWAGAITIAYWIILLVIPVPGHGAYNLTPEGNLCAFIDQKLLPGSFCCYEYGDNEGILSNIPAIASVLLGVWGGNILLERRPHATTIRLFLIVGFSLIILSLLWNIVYPINKYLWTGSYVALSTGLSFLSICLFYWLIDVKGYTKWAFPFVVIGMNPITIYLAQALFDFGIIANIFIHGFVYEMDALSIPFYELCVLFIKWLLLYFLYKQKIFLKV